MLARMTGGVASTYCLGNFCFLTSASFIVQRGSDREWAIRANSKSQPSPFLFLMQLMISESEQSLCLTPVDFHAAVESRVMLLKNLCTRRRHQRAKLGRTVALLAINCSEEVLLMHVSLFYLARVVTISPTFALLSRCPLDTKCNSSSCPLFWLPLEHHTRAKSKASTVCPLTPPNQPSAIRPFVFQSCASPRSIIFTSLPYLDRLWMLLLFTLIDSSTMNWRVLPITALFKQLRGLSVFRFCI